MNTRPHGALWCAVRNWNQAARATMTIDERIEAITMNLELARREIQDLKELARQDGENIRALARIAEIHERREKRP
jgi:hypothetical protein